MPQLDTTSFPSQLFWLVLTFVPLLIIMWSVALPRVGQVLAARRQRIEGDLAEAARLRDEAARLTTAYEQALAGAHEKARAELRKVADEAAAEQAKSHAALAARLTDQIKAGEARIAAAKDDALRHIRVVAGEAAAAATERLIGVRVAPSEVEAAVEATQGGRP